MLQKLFGLFSQKKSAAPTAHSSIPTIPSVMEIEIPRYPPFMKGLPAADPERLIKDQDELIRQLRSIVNAPGDVFDRYYMATLRNFAAFVHLLPASQGHHHRGAGGLLRHTLEVALWAMQGTERMLICPDEIPQIRREIEPRWHFAVFAAALCHDVGKPVTDITVSDRDHAHTWNPISGSLQDWLAKNQIDRYFIHWKDGRHKKHEEMANVLAARIIGEDALVWMSNVKVEIVGWIYQTLNRNPSSDNQIYDLVIRADQISVERDLRDMGVKFADHDLGVPSERFIVDAMRRLVREGKWKINEPGARVWHLSEGLFVVWPLGGDEIAQIIQHENIPGLPRSSQGILDMMLERNMATHAVNADGELQKVWTIAPDVLREKMPNIELHTVKLREPTMLEDPAPPKVGGQVVVARNREASAATPQQQSSAPIGSVADFVVPNGEQSAPASAAPKAKEESSSVVKQKTAPEAVDLDSLDITGDFLKALVDDLQQGIRKWGEDAILDSQGRLCIHYPKGIEGYGLETKTILGELAGTDLLDLDEMSPLKKVLDVEFSKGKTVKALRFVKAVSKALNLENMDVVANKPAQAPVAEPAPVTTVAPVIQAPPEMPEPPPITDVPSHVQAKRSAPKKAAIEKAAAKNEQKKQQEVEQGEKAVEPVKVATETAKTDDITAPRSKGEIVNLILAMIEAGTFKHHRKADDGKTEISRHHIIEWVKRNKAFGNVVARQQVEQIVAAWPCREEGKITWTTIPQL